MIVKDVSLSTSAKVALFRNRFSGLSHVYGTYDLKTKKVSVVKEPVTDQVIFDHLKGMAPYGVFLLKGDRIRALAVDFDTHDRDPVLQFLNRLNHYNLQVIIEASKSKGFHGWIFFDGNGVKAAKARTVAKQILLEIECPQTEIFPKQDSIDSTVQYGNFINAPLFGALVPHHKTVFVDPNHDFLPYTNQWVILQKACLIKEQEIDALIEINSWHISPESKQAPRPVTPGSFYTLPPCAQQILEQGVSAYQRSTCFRLASHFKRIGLPLDIAIAVLTEWASKNKPAQGKRIITSAEIVSQTNYAYQNEYRGYGCEDPAIQPFCDLNCPVKTKPEITKPTTKGNKKP